MMKKRSKVLFVNSILSTLYFVYLISYFFGANTETTNSAEAIGAAIATALILPHMITIGIGVIFSWLAFSYKKVGFALTAAILFSVSSILMILYIIFTLPLIILGFVGYSKQKKINN